ncbi:MAG: hypothetical protein HQM13_19290 [SAR324 cluster bacterium]|nr:hypothetical protein [SAR324 cluster bacterium]
MTENLSSEENLAPPEQSGDLINSVKKSFVEFRKALLSSPAKSDTDPVVIEKMTGLNQDLATLAQQNDDWLDDPSRRELQIQAQTIVIAYRALLQNINQQKDPKTIDLEQTSQLIHRLEDLTRKEYASQASIRQKMLQERVALVKLIGIQPGETITNKLLDERFTAFYQKNKEEIFNPKDVNRLQKAYLALVEAGTLMNQVATTCKVSEFQETMQKITQTLKMVNAPLQELIRAKKNNPDFNERTALTVFCQKVQRIEENTAKQIKEHSEIIDSKKSLLDEINPPQAAISDNASIASSEPQEIPDPAKNKLKKPTASLEDLRLSTVDISKPLFPEQISDDIVKEALEAGFFESFGTQLSPRFQFIMAYIGRYPEWQAVSKEADCLSLTAALSELEIGDCLFLRKLDSDGAVRGFCSPEEYLANRIRANPLFKNASDYWEHLKIWIEDLALHACSIYETKAALLTKNPEQISLEQLEKTLNPCMDLLKSIPFFQKEGREIYRLQDVDQGLYRFFLTLILVRTQFRKVSTPCLAFIADPDQVNWNPRFLMKLKKSGVADLLERNFQIFKTDENLMRQIFKNFDAVKSKEGGEMPFAALNERGSIDVDHLIRLAKTLPAKIYYKLAELEHRVDLRYEDDTNKIEQVIFSKIKFLLNLITRETDQQISTIEHARDRFYHFRFFPRVEPPHDHLINKLPGFLRINLGNLKEPFKINPKTGKLTLELESYKLPLADIPIPILSMKIDTLKDLHAILKENSKNFSELSDQKLFFQILDSPDQHLHNHDLEGRTINEAIKRGLSKATLIEESSRQITTLFVGEQRKHAMFCTKETEQRLAKLIKEFEGFLQEKLTSLEKLPGFSFTSSR